MSTANEIGTIMSLWRYPVKSMMGEVLSVANVKDNGIWGDRSYAVIDQLDGKVATAKHPKKWPTLFTFQSTLMESSSSSEKMPSVRIRLADGTEVTSDQRDLNKILSQAFNREVTLAVTEGGKVTGVQSSLPNSWAANSEEYWPDIDGREKRDTVTDFALPTGTFFDGANVHLLTTSTLAKLSNYYPLGSFKIQRFRPNIVVESFVDGLFCAEESWVGRTVAIGDQVRLNIIKPCPRCVMTTLPQGDLPKDNGILHTAVQYNQGNVGVYASVLQSGMIRPGDKLRLES